VKKIISITRSHNSSLCLLENGEITFHIENERLSKIKYDDYCFNAITHLPKYVSKVDTIALAGMAPAWKIDPKRSSHVIYCDQIFHLNKSFNVKTKIFDAWETHHLQHAFCSFYNSGFNVRATDIAASIGLSQFRDLDKFIKTRNINRKKIIKELNKSKVRDKIFIIEGNKGVKASWFGIPIVLSKKINKKLFIKKIEKDGIETRPIISGNFLNQPSIKKYNLRSNTKMKNADYVNNYGFFIGLPTKPISSLIIKKLVRVFEKSV